MCCRQVQEDEYAEDVLGPKVEARNHAFVLRGRRKDDGPEEACFQKPLGGGQVCLSQVFYSCMESFVHKRSE